MAAVLFNIATLLRERGENPYRIRAYERGARALMARRDDVARVLGSGKPLPRRKYVLGERLQNRLREMAETGDSALLHELCADLPPYIENLMQVPGIGPRNARLLHEALHVDTAEELVEAARAGKVGRVWGFGEKRQAAIAQLSLFDMEMPEETPRLRLAA
jgi:DNA polymerase (family 10)